MKMKRTFWPYGIMAAFGIFFVGVAAMVTIAATHPEDLVSDNYYEHELNYQNQIDASVRASSAGADVRYDSTVQTIVVTVPAGQEALFGKVEFYRPDAPGLDRLAKLAPGKDGSQTVDVSGLAAGPWHVRISWEAGGQDYYLERKLIFPGR